MMNEEQRRSRSRNVVLLIINRMCKSSNLAKLILSDGAHKPDTLYFILQALAEQKRKSLRERRGGVASHVQEVVASASRLQLRARSRSRSSD